MTTTLDRSVIYLWLMLMTVGVLAVSSVTLHVEGTWLNSLFLRHLLYVLLSGTDIRHCLSPTHRPI